MRRFKRWCERRLRGNATDASVIDVSLMRAWTGQPAPRKGDLLQTPQLLKTRIAREVAVAVVVRAHRPIARGDVLELTLVDPKVQAAGVSRSTVSSQLAAALAENPPRIIRLCRGIYAAADVGADAADVVAPVASGTRTGLRTARAAG